MTAPTVDQIELVQAWLPVAAVTDYGWDAAKVSEVMSDNAFTPTQAVRFFWLERVNESVEYIDISGKPLTQIHAQARAMLDYWDNILKMYGVNALGPPSGADPGAKRPISFGEIDRS